MSTVSTSESPDGAPEDGMDVAKRPEDIVWPKSVLDAVEALVAGGIEVIKSRRDPQADSGVET